MRVLLNTVHLLPLCLVPETGTRPPQIFKAHNYRLLNMLYFDIEIALPPYLTTVTSSEIKFRADSSRFCYHIHCKATYSGNIVRNEAFPIILFQMPLDVLNVAHCSSCNEREAVSA